MIVEHLTRIARAATVQETWRTKVELLRSYGFDRALYVSSRFRSARSIGDLQDALFLTQHDAAYLHAMLERGLIRHAPMVRRDEPGGRLWDDAAGSGLGAMVLRAREHLGLAAGCDVVFRGASGRSWGAVELCARPGMSRADVAAVWSRHGSEIELLCNLAHLKISNLPSWAGRQPLTAKQRCVLHWASEGKTAQDTAIIMGLSPATVEKHLRLAREALDVQTTGQAIAKAAHWNQLFMDDELSLAG